VGVKDKNIKPFCGVPLVARTIRAALSANTIDRIIVSTDSESYAALCREHGADVIIRPAELASATSSSEIALLHVLERLEAGGVAMPDWLVFLQCTSPFTHSHHIDDLLNHVWMSGADSGFTAVPSHRFLWRRSADETVEGVNHDKTIRLLRQDREPEFAENGAVYVMRTKGFLKHKHRFFGKTVLLELPEHHGMEIDSEIDWQIAETVGRKLDEASVSVMWPAHPELVVFDFDGVFTDNRVFVSEDGKETVACDRGDGMALEWLLGSGIPSLILSKERNPVVEARARKVGIPAVQATDNKAAYLRTYFETNAINPQNVIYVGNDVNDLECFKIVGCSVAVADAVREVIDAATIVLKKSGGRGAIREVVEIILSRHQSVPNTLNKIL
jgi:YrbI family 3-deoxy-D-manno-octulosonate 8-phosphate phosphatase